MHKPNLVQHWDTPYSNLDIASEEVHIWYANLDLSTTAVDKLEILLTDNEREKANRFRFEKHRRRFIIARGRLRQILTNYLPIPASEIIFDYSDRGKPSLSDGLNKNNLQFNLSHSDNLALYAFTRQKRIGIDVEYLCSRSEPLQIARRFFAPEEYKLIASVEENRQLEMFLHIWTIKEAYLKATGEGLSGSLDAAEVFFQGEKPQGLATIGGNAQKASEWLVHSFIPTANFIATVVVENKLNPIQQQKIKFWKIL